MTRRSTLRRALAAASLLAANGTPALVLAAPPAPASAAPAAAAATSSSPLTSVARYHAPSGFIDDPLAVAPDGKSFAFLVTDGATSATLHLWRPGDATKPASDVAIPHDSITPERVDFLDATRVLVVDRDATSGLARARVYTERGPGKERLGPADAISLATVDGTPAIVTYARSQNAKGTAHVLAAYRRSDLKLMARRSLSVPPDGWVPAIDKLTGPFQPQAFVDGNATLLALSLGAFDAAKDVRAPSRAVRIPLFQPTIAAAHEVAQPMEWAALVERRKKHPGESRFLQMADDLRTLELVDDEDRVRALTLPTPLRKYDPTTLAYQVPDDASEPIPFALQIDPVNADAVASKKADVDWIDLYRVDGKTAAVTPLARIAGDKRHARWRVRQGSLLVLRQHKGFARGGVDLELFQLPPR